MAHCHTTQSYEPRFPSTVITVQFSHDSATASGGPLRSRTNDGLEVSLEMLVINCFAAHSVPIGSRGPGSISMYRVVRWSGASQRGKLA